MLGSARKAQTFADAFDPRSNSFGLLRLLLAVLVIFSHSYTLGGFGIDPLETFTSRRHTIGLVAVAMFFVLSGFLICRSASKSASVSRFLWHRFLRIFPGYWVCLIVCACVFAPFVALYEHGLFFRVFAAPANSPQAYVLGNISLFHLHEFSVKGITNIRPQHIAGLLSHNPYPYLINGSLWTLPFEVCCYAAVALLALVGVLRRMRIVMLLLLVTLWGLHAWSYLEPDAFFATLPCRALPIMIMLSLFFSAGCTCFLYREAIPCSTVVAVTCAVALAASAAIGAFGLIAPGAMSYALLWLAFRLPFRRFDAHGDISYGTYIYAFPVQQGLALLGLQRGGFTIYFVSSLLLTLLLAMVSYRCIEAPSLRLKGLQIANWGFWMSEPPAPSRAIAARFNTDNVRAPAAKTCKV